METSITATYSLFVRRSFSLLHSFSIRSENFKAVSVIVHSFLSTPASIQLPTIRFKIPEPRKFLLPSSTYPHMDTESSRQLGLLIEVDVVLADVSRLGNRQAFNVAFQKLGLDCANWTEPIYADLKRKTAGDEERMVILFFNRIGWPTSLPTNEKEVFMKSVMREKKKAQQDFAMSSNFALRPGVENFIDDAIKEGLSLVLLTAYSKNGDEVCRSVIEKLGHDRAIKIKVIGKEEVQQSLYGQLVLGKGVSSSLAEQLVKEARKAVSTEKERVAEEVSSILSVDIDASSTESTDLIVATLRVGAEHAGLPAHDCVLIAGSQSGVAGAKKIGMPSVAIRSSSTPRAEFRTAKVVMDGFGGAELTVSKLLTKRFCNHD